MAAEQIAADDEPMTTNEEFSKLLWERHSDQIKWEIVGALVALGKKFEDFPQFIREWIFEQVGPK